MSTEDERRARRAAAAARTSPAHTRVGTTPSLLGTQGPTAAEYAAEHVPGQLSTDEVLSGTQAPAQGPREVVGHTDEHTPEPVPVFAEDEPLVADAPETELDTAAGDPPTGDDAPENVEHSDGNATVRHDAEDAPSNGVDEGDPVEGDRPVIDDGKAAGEAMRRERQQRGRATPRHGHGWLDVEAFTEHLRTARLRPIGTGQSTVNVRVSTPLAEALEAYRREADVSKRDVVEALLLELLGPAVPEGGRR